MPGISSHGGGCHACCLSGWCQAVSVCRYSIVTPQSSEFCGTCVVNCVRFPRFAMDRHWHRGCSSVMVPSVGAHLGPPYACPAQRRTWAHPPQALGPATGGMAVQFAGFRGAISESALATYNQSGLGTVIWPQYNVMYSVCDMPRSVRSFFFVVTRSHRRARQKLDDWISLLQDRPWLWLADISNYVPGDNGVCDPAPPSSVCEYHAPQRSVDLLVARLGDRFTGMDNGEQDGRYIGGYSSQLLRGSSAVARKDVLMSGGADPASALLAESARRRGYLNFRRHFERLEGDLGYRMMSLNSLWAPHYYAVSGYYTMLGAETAQGLPNDQLFYAFLRGAAKQYGTLIWGDASIGNRWWGTEGPKRCQLSVNNSSECVCSTNGTSISLLRRLMWSQLLYGSAVMSFEGGLTCSGANGKQPVTSPIGQVQKAGMQWASTLGKSGGLGVHVATAAVMLDFFQGFTPPRHLYADHVYRVWGGIPWGASDFWAHGVLDALFPGYERASFFHNESGFLTGTPYGDIADVMLSDAPGWLLNQYGALILGSPLLAHRAETAAKLARYVESGGTLLVAGAALASGVPLLGLELDLLNRTGDCHSLRSGTSVKLHMPRDNATRLVVEPAPVTVCRLSAPADAVTIATSGGASLPLAVQVTRGNGSVIALASTGVAVSEVVPLPIPHVSKLVDTALPNPFPLAQHAAALLDFVLGQQRPFDPGAAAKQTDGLSVISTRVEKGQYNVIVQNHGLREQNLSLTSNLGKIISRVEMTLSDSWINAVNTNGYTATHTPAGTDLGKSTATTIAGLDSRLFRVVVEEDNGTSLVDPGAAAPPADSATSRGVGLPLQPGIEQVLLRPTLTQHLDRIVVDWRHLERTELTELIEEGAWFHRQNITVIVDLTSGLNLYPDLRLVNNSAVEYADSISRIIAVLEKAAANVGTGPSAQYSTDVVLSLHRTPENDYSPAKCQHDFAATTRRLAAEAASRDITLHLRVGTDGKQPSSLAAAELFLDSCGRPKNLKLALGTAMAVGGGIPIASIADSYDSIGLWLVSAPVYDPWGSSASKPTLLTNHGTLASVSSDSWVAAETSKLLRWVRSRGGVILLDAALPVHDGTDADGLDAEYREIAALVALF